MAQKKTKLSPSDLAAMLCARVCHDLISPVSALQTALEVLDDEDNADMHEHALELVKISAKNASSQLQFLRLAFGAGSSAPGVVSLDTVKTLVDGVYGEGKQTIHWQTEVTGLDKPVARLLLNMIALSINTIPLGGDMYVSIATDPSLSVVLTCTGRKARITEALTLTLAGQSPEDGFDGKTIHSFYAGMMVRELGATLRTSLDGETVTMAFEKPALPEQSAA